MKAHSRFWWRALDATLPAEPRMQAAPTAPFWSKTPRQKPAPAMPVPDPFTLTIPKGERRKPPRAAPGTGTLATAALTGALLTSVFAISGAMAMGLIERQRVEILLSSQIEGALMSAGFGIDQISLHGHHYTLDRDIYEALELRQVRTLAAFDAPAALKRLEALPWIETAQISRVFPGALRVEVRERRPAALWRLAGKTYLIDATGRALGSAAEPQNWKLPVVAGEGANTEAPLLFTALNRHPEVASVLERAERIGSRRWSLVFKNGSRVELGADREVEGLEQLTRNTELRQLFSKAFVADLRTNGRLAMRPVENSKLSGRLP